MLQMTYGHKRRLTKSKKLKKNSIKQCFSNMHLQALFPQHQAPETLQGGRFHRGLEVRLYTVLETLHAHNGKSCSKETCLTWINCTAVPQHPQSFRTHRLQDMRRFQNPQSKGLVLKSLTQNSINISIQPIAYSPIHYKSPLGYL